ncbi:MAG TPA: YkyB family protein [Bacillota bacterium]|nr:YkyB family protein [Bacillota bacterium]
MRQYTHRDHVPADYKTKEDLQKVGRIPTGSPIAKLKDKNRILYLFDAKQSAPIPSRSISSIQVTPENLAKAIYVVNRHAKTSPEPQKLYQLKTLALERLIHEGKAQKVGLQQSPNPSKFHQQTSNTLVKVGEYGFHILSTREDLLELPHLGTWSEDFRNPTDSFPLRQAVQLLERYVGIKDKAVSSKPTGAMIPKHQRKSFLDPFPKRKI